MTLAPLDFPPTRQLFPIIMLDSLDRDFVLTLEFQLLYRPDDLSLQGFSRCWSNSPHHHPPRSLPARCLIEKAFVPHHWLVTLAVRTDFLSERHNFQCGMNGGKRLRGCCPHPRAPGALALSLDRERDLEMDTETEANNSQTRRDLQ